MPSDYDNNLLREAIINIKAKDFSLARRYLERALDTADDRDTRIWANYWMSQVTNDPQEKRKYLEETIANDPTHPEARKALAVLDGKIKLDEIVNPDALPAQSTDAQNAKADRFACPKCGARMVFDGDGRTLVCEHCTRSQSLSGAAPEFEQDFILTMATGKGHRKPVAVKTFNCKGCGAQFILPPQEISSVCAYCGSPHVVIGTKELVEPDSVIPMGFNQRQAAHYLVQWVEKHKITPQGKVQAPQGIYLPVWTFDIFGNIPWSGTVYRNKQVVSVSGETSVSFNDIAIPGAPRLADLLPKIMPSFDTNNAPAYDPRYLSGWPAEVYEKAMSDSSLDARKQAVERARDKIRSQVGHVNDLNYNTSGLSVLSFKLVLVPIWYTTYPFEGRTFRVLINGQNGTVYGETLAQGIMGWIGGLLGD
jgi:DNA-directed RNA polymerase subunit RPC12/RpoP